MANKPELLVTAGSIEEVKRLIDAGADALAIGSSRFGMRLPGDFTAGEIAEATAYAHERNRRIYVVANTIVDNELTNELPAYMQQLADADVDAVVFGDPAVLMAMKQAGVKLPLHWNPEMTATNYVTANYWGTKGAERVIIARELNFDEAVEVKQNTTLQVQVQVHGMTNIYHSKRSLVAGYFEHQGRRVEEEATGAERGLYLIEAERPDERFPIYEDVGGTHIMSSEDLCMLENIHEFLEAGFDSLKIEGLLKSIEYNETVVKAYRTAIDAWLADPEAYEFQQEWLDAIEQVQPENRPFTFGFYYKEQVY